ncbi:hypothetical protein STEG23_036506, partial [Scotinomys teguina]
VLTPAYVRAWARVLRTSKGAETDLILLSRHYRPSHPPFLGIVAFLYLGEVCIGPDVSPFLDNNLLFISPIDPGHPLYTFVDGVLILHLLLSQTIPLQQLGDVKRAKGEINPKRKMPKEGKQREFTSHWFALSRLEDEVRIQRLCNNNIVGEGVLFTSLGLSLVTCNLREAIPPNASPTMDEPQRNQLLKGEESSELSPKGQVQATHYDPHRHEQVPNGMANGRKINPLRSQDPKTHVQVMLWTRSPGRQKAHLSMY